MLFICKIVNHFFFLFLSFLFSHFEFSTTVSKFMGFHKLNLRNIDEMILLFTHAFMEFRRTWVFHSITIFIQWKFLSFSFCRIFFLVLFCDKNAFDRYCFDWICFRFWFWLWHVCFHCDESSWGGHWPGLIQAHTSTPIKQNNTAHSFLFFFFSFFLLASLVSCSYLAKNTQKYCIFVEIKKKKTKLGHLLSNKNTATDHDKIHSIILNATNSFHFFFVFWYAKNYRNRLITPDFRIRF